MNRVIAQTPWRDFAAAPLGPLALAATLGLLLDHTFTMSADRLAAFTFVTFLGWLFARRSQPEYAYAALLGTIVGLAALHHHIQHHVFPNDDVGNVVGDGPKLVHLRGVLTETPLITRSDPTDLFGPAYRVDRASSTLDASEIRDAFGRWQPASGRVRLSIERPISLQDVGLLDHVQVGDSVEVIGMLVNPLSPGNPGEWNYAEFLLDARIRAELHIHKTDAALTRLDTAGRGGYWLTQLRGRLTQQLDAALPARIAGLARALLLGDGSAMSRDEWDAFARTGVVHVLAISGQHLVILAGFLGVLLRIANFTPRRGAWLLIGVIVGYALLTGGRPSAMRAAVMVVVTCGGWLLRRPTHPTNTFALAWLIVLMLDPHDPFTTGCQLSFLSVFVLIWFLAPLLTPVDDPLRDLLEESRPQWEQYLRQAGRWFAQMYLVTATLMLVTAPLIMLRQNLVPVSGLLLGPLLVLLTSFALIVGFLLLLVGGLFPLTLFVRSALGLADWLVTFADRWPGGTVYVATPSLVWVSGFYLFLLAAVLLNERRILYAFIAWIAFGLLSQSRVTSDELRVTFLSVGHGGCTVLECPDGRVMLYDAGTMSGSAIVKRTIAPYLWHRGITRIDELFLSHADLDHYNGVAELLKRFPVGMVTLTPSFAARETAPVARVLVAIREARVPMRLAVAGQRFTAGDVRLDVLHPPDAEFGVTENERSLVLKCTHRGHTILLTGDLEKHGTQRLLKLPPVACDVLMAPHHGSAAAMSAELLRWATPKMLVVSRGFREGAHVDKLPMWDTWSAGAITLRSQPTGLIVESFRRNERLVLRRGT